MTSQILKQSENIIPPVMPMIKSKRRILSTVTNKDTRVTDTSLDSNKAAVERQRENAAKLASGLSVVSKVDKENEGVFKKPVKVQSKLPQKTRKPLDEKRVILQKSDSFTSINQQEIVKAKEKLSAVLKPVPRPKRNSEYKEKAKIRVVVPIEKEKIEEKIKKDDEEEEEIPLSADVIDIDEEGGSNEFILGLYAKDIYDFLRYMEKVQNIKKNYLTSAHNMTQQMRAILVDWIFEVQQSFRLLNETVQLAIALLDRFMQDHPGIVKDELQLVTVACIFLASKYEEICPPDLDDMMHVSANAYTKHQILKMEQIIFAALDFQMGRPLPSQFLRRYGRVANVDLITYCFAKYFIDLSLVSYTLCHLRPSLLAAAALYLSLYLTTEDSNTEFWTPTLAYYTKYSSQKLRPIVSQVASIVLEAPKSKCQAVHNKYLDPKLLHSVSDRKELKSEKLSKIANESETSL